MTGNQGATKPLPFRIGLDAQRGLLILGLVGSLTVATCNTIMCTHGDIALWPEWSLRLAYWAGSFALAFAGLGFLPTYTMLRPAGVSWAAPPAILLGGFLALGSAGHGSFFAHYRILRWLALDPTLEPAMGGLRDEIALDNLVMVLIPVAVLFVGSMWYSAAVLTRPTLYPRWMAGWNIFAISAVVFGVAETAVDGELVQGVARGLGFHLGVSGYFLLCLYALAKARSPQ